MNILLAFLFCTFSSISSAMLKSVVSLEGKLIEVKNELNQAILETKSNKVIVPASSLKGQTELLQHVKIYIDIAELAQLNPEIFK